MCIIIIEKKNLFLFNSLNYYFRNKYFIEECFNTFVNKLFTVIIFYKDVFNFTNFLMKFRHVRAYGKTAKNNSRNYSELIIQRHVTIKMHVDTTKGWFMVSRSGKNIVFSDIFDI